MRFAPVKIALAGMALAVPACLLATPPASASPCVIVGNNGFCGGYNYYPAITNSNGYNTYVGPNCWADPGCQFTTTVTSPGNWNVVATEPAGNTAVRAYPEIQQLMNNYSTDGTWSGFDDTPIAGLSALYSRYTETMPHNAGTIAQAAWDIWLSSNGSGNANEVMVWVDNSHRGSGGASQIGSATVFGQPWTLYRNGTDELIWSLGSPGFFRQQGSGTGHLLSLLRQLVRRGLEAPGTRIGQIDFGWEICSTGGTPEKFSVSHYDLHTGL